MKEITAIKKANARVIAIYNELARYDQDQHVQQERVTAMKNDLFEYLKRNKLNPNRYSHVLSWKHRSQLRDLYYRDTNNLTMLIKSNSDDIILESNTIMNAEDYLAADIEGGGQKVDLPYRVIELMENYHQYRESITHQKTNKNHENIRLDYQWEIPYYT